MNRLFTLLILLCAANATVNAQTATSPFDEPFGKVDQADIEMKACGFEKDANAEVLIHKCNLYYSGASIFAEYHERIKVFNNEGTYEANVVLPCYGNNSAIQDIEAETINDNNGAIEVTKLDKKLVYTKYIDTWRTDMIFTMPNVKAGSIIEFKFTYHSFNPFYIPPWYFQREDIPVRYSEIDTKIPEQLTFTTQFRSHENLTEDKIWNEPSLNCESRVMDSIPSLIKEPYMRSVNDNLASITFVLTGISPSYGIKFSGEDTWNKVGAWLIHDEDFGHQFKENLTGEDTIISHAKTLKTDDEKIAYLFNKVKNMMKWNGLDEWYTNDGTSKAWGKKTGNSSEINLILYNLLEKSGVAAMPMLVSTRSNGIVNPLYTFAMQFNRTVVYIPVDSTKKYILDASDKYNQYNDIPADLLNSFGLYINPAGSSDLIFLEAPPAKQAVFIMADIKPEGKLSGTARISSFSYNRINSIKSYKLYGEKKYIDTLTNNDNNLEISSIKFDNMDVDTLPLVQNINFDLELAGSDGTYIYFNPNIFTSLHTNPFLNEKRYSDIDFGYRNNLTVTEICKIPAGYQVDAMPKSINMAMPDNSMVFMRLIGEQDGVITMRFTINYKKSIYFKEDYPTFHEFFKKMYELMNEQIVLKKS